MPLPAPNLDDRRFQDLVDEAKRMVQQRCPEWTDHNVSDPGVTLIELFASMTDQLLYRLNRVPDRHYVKFLELLGVRPYPATAAHGGITFRLSGPIEQQVTVPAGTRVSTVVSDLADAVVFTTTEELTMPPCELVAVKTAGERRAREDRSGVLTGGRAFTAFTAVPEPGDHLLLGLSGALQTTLQETDAEIQALIDGIPPENRKLVTNHDSLGYFADRYGLEIVGAVIPNLSTEADPSAGDVAELADLLDQSQIPAIFTEQLVDPKVAEQLASDTGVDLIPGLYTDALGPEGSGADTLHGMLLENARTIVEGLG